MDSLCISGVEFTGSGNKSGGKFSEKVIYFYINCLFNRVVTYSLSLKCTNYSLRLKN